MRSMCASRRVCAQTLHQLIIDGPTGCPAAPEYTQVELPRPSPRFTADALQRHIEKHLAALQAGA